MRRSCGKGSQVYNSQIKRLRADLAEAIEALKPFAAIKNIAHPRYDPTFVMTQFTFEDCEHASTIVEKHKGEKP